MCRFNFFCSFLFENLGRVGMLGAHGWGEAIKTMENSAKTNDSVSGLNPVDLEVIQLFVQFSRAVGQPRSVAEIYGLLFVSHLPLTLNDLEERLNISRGSACHIHQKLNRTVFKNPAGVMKNIMRVTGHLRKKLEARNVRDLTRRSLVV